MIFMADLANRENQLRHWLKSQLNTTDFSLRRLAGDASFRGYYRLEQNHTHYVVMDAPPPKEDCRPFVDIANQLKAINLNAPEICFKDLDNGFLLLSDFGDISLESMAFSDKGQMLYQKAIDDLIVLQENLDSKDYAPFDANHIKDELNLFKIWYLKKHLNLNQYPDLDKDFNYLIDICLSQKQVAIHRDYHSRNLMVIDNKHLGILDFQDAMLGPISYDLASLLKDCYVDLGETTRESLITYYLEKSAQFSLNDVESFTHTFNLMAAQRHLKAVGIFCRLNYRDNKANYLKELPLTLKYLRNIADKTSELSNLSQLFHDLYAN